MQFYHHFIVFLAVARDSWTLAFSFCCTFDFSLFILVGSQKSKSSRLDYLSNIAIKCYHETNNMELYFIIMVFFKSTYMFINTKFLSK